MIYRGFHGMGCAPAFTPAPASSGMGGGVAALLVSAEGGLPRGELERRGMAGMGDGILDTLTGGKVTQISDQLSSVELLLKVSAGAAVFAGLASLAVVLTGRR